jgi:hypothetical protein
MNIAFVKSSIYQDLWISDITSDIQTIFKTSLMRCSPIGLNELINTEFIIVKESNEYPCQVNPTCYNRNNTNYLKFAKQNKYPDLPFLDETFHSHISIDEVSHEIDSINWSKYNIVITINACIPDRVIQQYPSILWCYYIGENDDHLMNQLLGKYDILLNQDVFKNEFPPFSIGFPYTFLGPYTLENLYKTINNDETTNKHGIYIEINNTQERPVIHVPSEFNQISNIVDIPLYLHNQNIFHNLSNLYKCSYFIKLYGRVIRGNSILESISCGTLVLINKHLLIYKDLIPDECHVETPQDIIQKITFLEKNKDVYYSLLNTQRKILEENYYKKPIQQLVEKYNLKYI